MSKKLAAAPLLVLCCVLAMGADGCTDDTRAPKSIREELAKTEIQQEKHLKTTPPPSLTKSQERANLIERLNRFNTDDKVSWIYLVDYGKVMAFYTVKGKVSSVNSLLTQPVQPYKVNVYGERDAVVTVPSPDLDGSYGTNGDAIFFFTTDGTYCEWSGKYLLVDKPLKLTTPPNLVRDLTAEEQAQVGAAGE